MEVEKGNQVGSFINNWGKIIASLVFIVSTGSIAYYNIFQNQRDIEQLRHDDTGKIMLLERRNDKRHARQGNTNKELKQLHWEDESRIIELEKEVSELKGIIVGFKLHR